MERKNTRKTLTGTVVSAKNSKTVTVAVDTYVKHPLYGKRFKVTKKFATHDEKEIASEGDIVRIAETRPLSKTKRFRLVEIREKAKEGAK
ncbi:30S ribosomal protein S17 [Mycoplasma procyoni]|uniref:30S ribosomal protein S17 n=1 Tax=Mycoplasma procyoni TaxID=568784 RepID=UPI00197C8E7B|nr:30S ribosomal protein S17 [Mycoplasma procyoni]MBN3534988.1 30S ribosomal protein S17 [Mycoplasma procyoni]